MDLITGQLVVSYLAVQAQEWLKRASWFPWVQRGSARANRVLAAVKYASTWYAKQHGGVDFAIVQTASALGEGDHHALTPTEAQHLIATTFGTSPIDLRDHALIVLALETGMRRLSLIHI